MKYLGEDGVAAITIVLYVEFLLVAVYLGFSSGIAPILSYNYGEGNRLQLKRLFRMSLYFVLGCSVISFSVSILCAKQLVGIFTPQGSQVYTLAVHGFYLYAICYLFKGINTFASSLFTALSDGITSAFLSFMRTLGFDFTGASFAAVCDQSGWNLAGGSTCRISQRTFISFLFCPVIQNQAETNN